MQPTTYLSGLCLLLACACASGTNEATQSQQNAPQTVANEHGCDDKSNYRWSALQQRCVRLDSAAIKLASTGTSSPQVAYLLFAAPDQDAQAEVFLPGAAGRLLAKAADEGAGSWTRDTLTLSQWKGMYSLSGAKGIVLYEGHANTDELLGDGSLSGEDVPTMLAGTWQRADKASERFTILGKTLTHYTDGKKGPALAFAYVPDCGGTACAGQQSPYGCLTTAGQFDIDCQRVEVITNTELALSEGATGNTVRYLKRRKP